MVKSFFFVSTTKKFYFFLNFKVLMYVKFTAQKKDLVEQNSSAELLSHSFNIQVDLLFEFLHFLEKILWFFHFLPLQGCLFLVLESLATLSRWIPLSRPQVFLPHLLIIIL